MKNDMIPLKIAGILWAGFRKRNLYGDISELYAIHFGAYMLQIGYEAGEKERIKDNGQSKN